MPRRGRSPRTDGVHVLPTPVPVADAVDGEVLGGGTRVSLPWDLDRRVPEVEAAVAGVDRHVRANRTRLGPHFVARWAGFHSDWRQFLAAHQTMLNGAWRGALGWSDVDDRLVQYERGVTQWRRAAEERGVRFVTSAGAPRPHPPEKSSAWDEAKPVAIAAAVGLSALAVIAVVNKLS